MTIVKILNLCSREGCFHPSNQHLLVDYDNTDLASALDCGAFCAANPDCKCLSVVPTMIVPEDHDHYHDHDHDHHHYHDHYHDHDHDIKEDWR